MLNNKHLAGILTLILVTGFTSPAFAGGGPLPEFALNCYMPDLASAAINPDDVNFEDKYQKSVVDPNEDQRYCVEALKHSSTPPPTTRYWVEHEDDVNSATSLIPSITLQDQFLGTYTGNLFHFEFLMSAEVTSGATVTGDINNPLSGYNVVTPLPPVPAVAVEVTDIYRTAMITPQSHFAYHTAAIVDGVGNLVQMELACYMYEEDPNFVPIVFNPPQTWKTKFGTATVNGLNAPDVLCVIAKMITPPDPTPTPVGGEFLSIDSTALLLGTMQTGLIWWLPAVVIAGSAAAFFKLRSKNS